MHFLALALVLLARASGAEPSAGATSTLRVHIRGLHSGSGQVGCSIYDRGDGYPTQPQKALAKIFVPIRAEGDASATCEFGKLTPGDYAVSVFHDENGNGKLDVGFLHIPKEGYGATRDNLPRFSPPNFDDTKLRIGAGVTEVDVHLRYP